MPTKLIDGIAVHRNVTQCDVGPVDCDICPRANVAVRTEYLVAVDIQDVQTPGVNVCGGDLRSERRAIVAVQLPVRVGSPCAQ